jgi:hypothetical protein
MISGRLGVYHRINIIYGSGFGDTQGASYVTFGDQQVPVIAWSDVAIQITLNGLSSPNNLTVGTAYPIVVHLAGNSKQSNAVQFTLAAPPPPGGTTATTGTTGTTGTTTATTGTTATTTGTTATTGTTTATTGTTGTTTGTTATTGTTSATGTIGTPSSNALTMNDALVAEQIASQFFSTNAGKPYLTAVSATNPGTTTPSPTSPTAAPAASSTNLTSLKGMVDEMNSVHSAHVASLQQALGASAPAAPSFQNLDAPTLSQFLTMAQSIEDFAVGAQQGVVLSILAGTAMPANATSPQPDLFSTETAILADDGRFAGGIRSFRKLADTADGGDPNTTITENGMPFNLALTHQQVLDFLASYMGTSATPGTGTGTTGSTTGGTMPGSGTTGSTGSTPY